MLFSGLNPKRLVREEERTSNWQALNDPKDIGMNSFHE